MGKRALPSGVGSWLFPAADTDPCTRRFLTAGVSRHHVLLKGSGGQVCWGCGWPAECFP